MRRVFNSVHAFVMTALIIFPVLLFLERLALPEAELYSAALRAAPLMLCCLCGYLTRPLGSRASLAVFAAAAAGSIALTMWLTGGFSLFGVLCIIPAIVLYLVALSTYGSFPMSFCVGGLILYFAAMLIIPAVFKLERLTVLSACALVFLVLSMFSFNLNGMRLAMHSTAENRTRTPSGLAAKNLLMTACFITLCALVSLITPLKHIIIYPLRWLIMLWRWVRSLLSFDSPPPGEGAAAAEQTMPDLSDLGGNDHVEAEWVMYLVYALAALICLALLYVLIRKILRAAGSAGGMLGRLAQRFSALFTRRETEDYDDSVESLFSLDDLLRSGSEAISSTLNRIGHREPGFDAMPDTASKLRYTYRSLLKKEAKQSPGAAAKTPTELLRGRGEAFDAFANDYNAVRYSTHEPSDTAEDTAKAVLREAGGKKS